MRDVQGAGAADRRNAGPRPPRAWRPAAIALGAAWLVGAVFGDRATAATPPDPLSPKVAETSDRSSDAAFARAQLITAVHLFDQAFRVDGTGQYLDAIDLAAEQQPAGLSSIAATGIGLISLALSDALGVDPKAAEKAELTLRHLLNDDPRRRFRVDRSSNGWFVHYLHSESGRAPAAHEQRFSTIDTSILAIGAVIAGRYFEDKHAPIGSPAAQVAELSRRLLLSVDWPSAVRDLRSGRLHALLIGRSEAAFASYWSEPFDEYVLIPCLGRYVDRITGRRSPLSDYWDLHVADIDRLPRKAFGHLNVLARGSTDFVSHFTHQFAFYLCGSLGRDTRFQAALASLEMADRLWFSRRSAQLPGRWWGLGAGSALVWNDATRKDATELYVASTLNSGPEDDIFSPPIMAGFLAVDALSAENRPGPPRASRILGDLKALFSRGECLYRYGELRFLWRCSTTDPFRRVRFVQGIDFSTYMLGLSTLVPEIGLGFYRRYAP